MRETSQLEEEPPKTKQQKRAESHQARLVERGLPLPSQRPSSQAASASGDGVPEGRCRGCYKEGFRGNQCQMLSTNRPCHRNLCGKCCGLIGGCAVHRPR